VARRPVGPASLFLHPDRPLISENRTSTLLHELVHIALGVRGDEESDWIVEGTRRILFARNAASLRRHQRAAHKEAVRRLAHWAQRSTTCSAKSSTVAHDSTRGDGVRARRRGDPQRDGGKASLDDVARKLASEGGTVSLVRLQKVRRKSPAGRCIRWSAST
jgi:hypothetical protein